MRTLRDRLLDIWHAIRLDLWEPARDWVTQAVFDRDHNPPPHTHDVTGPDAPAPTATTAPRAHHPHGDATRPREHQPQPTRSPS